MAVDVKQLRIGSHISINGERVEVESLQGGDLVGYITPDNDWSATESWRFEPIAITPEILTELGFKKGMSSAIGFDSWYCDMMRIDNNVMQAHPWWFYNQVKLRYLHELESLYYMLHGVELIKV